MPILVEAVKSDSFIYNTFIYITELILFTQNVLVFICKIDIFIQNMNKNFHDYNKLGH